MHYRLWSQPLRSQVVLGLVERYRRYCIESPIREADQPVGRMAPIILVDVMTLLGQLLLRKGQGQADDYAIAIRPVHKRLVSQALPALKELSVKVFLVGDADIIELA